MYAWISSVLLSRDLVIVIFFYSPFLFVLVCILYARTSTWWRIKRTVTLIAEFNFIITVLLTCHFVVKHIHTLFLVLALAFLLLSYFFCVFGPLWLKEYTNLFFFGDYLDSSTRIFLCLILHCGVPHIFSSRTKWPFWNEIITREEEKRESEKRRRPRSDDQFVFLLLSS